MDGPAGAPPRAADGRTSPDPVPDPGATAPSAGAPAPRAPRWLLAVASPGVLVPAVYVPGAGLHPYVGPRALLLAATGVVALAAVLARAALGRGPRPRAGPIAWAVVLLLASHLASALAGIDRARSLHGTPERMLSLTTLGAGAAWFLAVATLARHPADARALLRATAAVGAAVSLLALAESAGLIAFAGAFPGRAGATLGNPVFLGAHGLWVAFAGALLALREPAPFGRRLGVAIAALGIGAVVASGTRGSLVGLAAGAVVAAGAAAEAALRRPGGRRAALGIVVAAAAVGGGGLLLRDAPVVRDLAIVRRFDAALDGTGSARVRALTWAAAVEAARERPWLGAGPSNYFHAFNFFYRPEFAVASPGGAFADDAHNVPLNAAAERGLLGLAATLLLAGVPLWVLLRGSERGRIDRASAAAAMAWATAHFTHGLFAFDEINGWATTFLFLALVDAWDAGPAPAAPPRGSGGAGRVGAAAAIVAGAAVLLLVVVPDVRAEAALVRARDAVGHGDPDAAARVAALARETAPRTRLAVLPVAELAAPAATRMAGAGRPAEALALLDAARAALDAVIAAHPHDVRAALAAGAAARAVAGIDATGAAAALEHADNALANALLFAPARQDLRIERARVLLLLGHPEEAVDLAEEAYESEPRAAFAAAAMEAIRRVAAAMETGDAGGSAAPAEAPDDSPPPADAR